MLLQRARSAGVAARTATGLAALIACACLVLPAGRAADPKAKRPGTEAELKTGKVSTIERKGKAAKLVVETDGGEKIELNITPKTVLSILGKGDVDFFRPNQMVGTEAMMANNQFFSKEFTIYLGLAPQPKATKDPQGETYDLCGQITVVDKDTLTVNFGAAGGLKKVGIEEGATVTVNSSDSALIVEGAAAEVEGKTHGTKFVPSSIKITLEAPLKVDDIYVDKKAAALKKAAEKKATKKSGKSKEEEPAAGEGLGETTDLFGLGTKDAKADKADKKKAVKKTDKKEKDAATEEKMDKP